MSNSGLFLNAFASKQHLQSKGKKTHTQCDLALFFLLTVSQHQNLDYVFC